VNHDRLRAPHIMNVKWLEERGTFAGLCPRDPRALREAMKHQHFARAQRRGAQTEGRIAIFNLKMNFSDDQCVRKGLPTAPCK
jgi:hypothetical protein